MRIKQALAASVTVLAAAGVLVGCGADNDDKANKDDQTISSSTDQGGEDAGVSTGGSTSITVEGKDLSSIDLDTVTCVKQAGKINVASAGATGQEGLAVVMTDEASPKVESLGIVVDDVALAVASQSGAEIGSAEVEVDGDEYTITGKAEGADTKDPTAGMISKEFEIKVTCS